MLNLLSRKKTSPIALDVGSDGVKMMQLANIGGEIRVVASARQRFERGLPEDADARTQKIAEIIHALCKDSSFRGRHVVSCLPARDLSIKNVRIARRNGPDMDEAVLEEASERFSFDVTPDQLRFINAGPVKDGTETRDEIIMIATPAEAVRQHLSLLKQAGLVCDCIDSEPTALFRTYGRRLRRQSDSETVSTTIDVGAGGTRLVVAKGRHILFLKRIDIGGDALNEAVAQQLTLSNDEAADLRYRLIQELSDGGQKTTRRDSTQPVNLDDSSQTYWAVYDGMREKALSLAREISLCLRYCSVTFRGLRMDEATIAGGQAYDTALVELFNEHVGCRCEVGRPLQGIDVSSSELQSERRGALAEWSVCAGLALRGLEMARGTQESTDAQYRLSA